MPSPIDAKSISRAAMLSAMALAVQYLESMLPAPVPGVPVRIGLANIFVLYPLLQNRRWEAAMVCLTRCLLFPLVARNASALLYALAGNALAYGLMALLLPLYRKETVGAVGVSVAGAFGFNVGQLLVGILLVGRAMAAYFPWMGLLSIPAGICTGLLCGLLIRRIRP